MIIFLYFGVKRFSDIVSVKKSDLIFNEDGDIRVWMKTSKTDIKNEGLEFSLSGRSFRGFSIKNIIKWYLRSFDRIPGEGFLFPKIVNGNPVWEEKVTYGKARSQLLRICENLGLEKLTLHSPRIGAASDAARAGVGREIIKKGGNWRSDALDLYIQVDQPGVILGDELMRRM